MKSLVFIIGLITSVAVFGTGGGNEEGTIKWEKYSPETKAKWVYLTESYELKEYSEVLGTLHWFYENAPDINVSLYQMGNEILSYVEKKEKDVIRKQVLRDSIIWAYENRVKFFGDEANVYDREGIVAFKYLYKQKEEDAHLYKLYSDIYKLKGNDMYIQNGKYYFNSAILMYSHKKIDKAEVIDVYEKVEVFYNYSKKIYVDKPATLSFIDATMKSDAQLFEKYIHLNCEEIESIYGETYNRTKELALAKKINKKMRTLISKGEKECVNSSLFLNTLKTIQEAEPTAKNSLIVAKVYIDMKDNEKAYAALRQATTLSTDSIELSSIYMNLAQMDAANGKEVSARSNALKSVKLNLANKTKAYTLIGDLYSASSCSSDNVLQAKAKYIAAYNMYLKAGNVKQAASVKKYFPTAQDIFNYNKSIGDEQSTGCWIGQTVKLISQ